MDLGECKTLDVGVVSDIGIRAVPGIKNPDVRYVSKPDLVIVSAAALSHLARPRLPASQPFGQTV